MIASLLGIAGYFHVFPGAEIFTLYDRVKGTFQDPERLRALPGAARSSSCSRTSSRTACATASLKSLWLMILLLALFLAFSRAAWGMAVFCVLLVALLAFINETAPAGRLRIVGLFRWPAWR